MKLKVVKSSDLNKGGSNRVFPGRDKKVALAIYIQGVAMGPVARITSKERKISAPVKRTILSEIAYNYFISLEGLPYSLAQYGTKGKWQWATMRWWERLEYHLSEIAEGCSFTYEIL